MIIAGHATVVNGKFYEAPTNTLTEILAKHGHKFVYIRHSIDGQIPSIAYWHEGEKVKESRIWVIRRPSILRYLSEIKFTFWYFVFHPRLWGRDFIGVDPLNAFTAIWLRRFGMVRRAIFFTADYSKVRFTSSLLNNAYHTLDRFCVRNADETWNVSSRIHQVRKEMGLDDTRNIFVPNVPSDDYKKFVVNKTDPKTIVTLGIIGEQLDFINLFDAFEGLVKKYPDLQLKIIGNGPKEDEYKALVKSMSLDKHVHFLGHLSHDDALDQISRSGIGLALYNGNWTFNYYGDSMKCREFFCFGLPVITTDTHSTVEEIAEANAGVVCEMSPDSYANAVREVLANYDSFSSASKKLAERFDGIHERLLSALR